MTVNHFGPYTLDEELEMRAGQIGSEILRACEALRDAERKATAAQYELEQLRNLRADYIGLLTARSTGPATELAWAEATKLIEERITEIASTP